MNRHTETRYGKSGRRGENNIQRGRILPDGHFITDDGSVFTPTGVNWSQAAMDQHEHADWADRHVPQPWDKWTWLDDDEGWIPDERESSR